MDPKQLIVLYSKYSDYCKKIVQLSENSYSHFIKFICVDNATVRTLLKHSKNIAITQVPCAILLYPDNRVEKFDGPGVADWIIEQISTHQTSSLNLPTVQPAQEPVQEQPMIPQQPVQPMQQPMIPQQQQPMVQPMMPQQQPMLQPQQPMMSQQPIQQQSDFAAQMQATQTQQMQGQQQFMQMQAPPPEAAQMQEQFLTQDQLNTRPADAGKSIQDVAAEMQAGREELFPQRGPLQGGMSQQQASLGGMSPMSNPSMPGGGMPLPTTTSFMG